MSSTILIRLPAVIARVGLCKSSIYGKIKQGKFPPPVKIGSRASAWVESELEDWLESCLAARDNMQNKSKASLSQKGGPQK